MQGTGTSLGPYAFKAEVLQGYAMTAELEAEKQVGFYQPYEIIWTKLWGDGDYVMIMLI